MNKTVNIKNIIKAKNLIKTLPTLRTIGLEVSKAGF